MVAHAQLNASQLKKDGVTVKGNALNELYADTGKLATKWYVATQVTGGSITPADTAAMLSPYLRSAAASSLYATVSALGLKLAISDTSAMLSPYLLQSAASGLYASLASLGLKLNVSDTAAMLGPYARLTDLPDISGKLNISDTSAMLANYADNTTLAGYSLASHTHTFGSLTSIPTTVSGYGITDVYDKTTADARYFRISNNLSEGTAATMRTNLGLGTAATQSTGTFLQTANNLSDVSAPLTARANLKTYDAYLTADQTGGVGIEITINNLSMVTGAGETWSFEVHLVGQVIGGASGARFTVVYSNAPSSSQVNTLSNSTTNATVQWSTTTATTPAISATGWGTATTDFGAIIRGCFTNGASANTVTIKARPVNAAQQVMIKVNSYMTGRRIN